MNCPKCGSPAYIEGNSACFTCRTASPLPLAPGWVPVSSAEALAAEWEDKATNYMRTAPAAANPSHRERIEAVSDTLWHCARQLRRQVVESDERQPAPNGGDEPRAQRTEK